MTTTERKATVEDLYNVPEHGKAELKGGMLVRMPPTGVGPGRAGLKISASLLRHEEEYGGGYAVPDNVGFLVDLPDRQSFSPDAAWYFGYNAESMKFVSGPPSFAVEVRSAGDYGKTAEREIAEKIAEYFAAGTLVVWDVDLSGEDVIKVHRADAPGKVTVYKRGEIAEAEPAVNGWAFPVDTLFK
jgi:Uma2 family endonuclease